MFNIFLFEYISNIAIIKTNFNIIIIFYIITIIIFLANIIFIDFI